jgi:sec-independent protein translocase protein TatA
MGGAMHLGWLEIVGILLIVIIIFGVGRISKIGSEFGKGIRNFREGLKGDQADETDGNSKDKSK